MPITLPELKTEIQSDPLALGYSSHLILVDGVQRVADSQALADILNLPRATIPIQRDTIDSHEIFEAIVPAEWGAASNLERQRVEMILSMGQINLKGSNTRASLAAAFGAGAASRTALIALQSRNGSRIEQLFGAGERVSMHQVGEAFNA